MHIMITEYVTQTLNNGTTPLVHNRAFVLIHLVEEPAASNPMPTLLTSPILGREEMKNYAVNMGGNFVCFQIQSQYPPITFSRLLRLQLMS